MLRWFATCTVLIAALAATGCAGKAKSAGASGAGEHRGPSDEVAQLQGTWEQQPELAPPATPKQRVVKQVSGDTETVTTYGPDGKVINAHTARFTLARRGGIPVYTFYDRRITAGPEQGRREAGPRSYLYRLRGEELDEVWGLLPGQEQREIVVKRWRRAAQER